MKKPFLIPISILTILATIFTSIGQSASSMENIGGRKWWTVDELYEKVEEMKVMASEKCGEDFGCRRNYYKELISDSEMAVADTFAGKDIIISGVSPSEQKMQMLYLGRPRLEYRLSDGQQKYLKNMYVGWLEEEDWETIGGDYNSLLASFQDKTGTSRMHLLYEGSFSDGNVPMPDETIDIFVGDDLNKIGRIYYILECTTVGDGTWGSIKFKNYLGEDFKSDKNYKMMFGEYAGFGFFEMEEDDEGKEEDDEGKDEDDGSEGEDEEMKDEKEIDNELLDGNSNAEDAILEVILAPDTGIIKKS